MLNYNFDRVFRARGIDKPFTYLKKAGFSDNFASKVKNNRVSRLNLKEIERICIVLKCTPNDIMEWQPVSDNETIESHPLSELRKTVTDVDLVKTISSIPLGQVGRIEKLIKEEIMALSNNVHKP